MHSISSAVDDKPSPMAQQVRSVFRVYLGPGETKFKVKLPNQARSLANASYSFDNINIIPDFYSKKALAYKLDSKSEEDVEIQHEARLIFSFGENVYKRNEYTQPENNMSIANIIKSINDYFDLYKPDSFTDVRFFIDWAHRKENATDISPEEFYKTIAPLMYDEEFDETKHLNALPESVRKFKGVNNFVFPSTDDEEALAEIRVRLWAGPNTVISFSSDNILQALGFQTEDMGKRGDKNRFHFQNTDTSGYRRTRASRPPETLVRTGGGRSKIYINTALRQFVSSMFQLKTTRKRERTNPTLAEDFNKSIMTKCRHYGMAFGLDFKEDEKIFQFKFPADDHVGVQVKLTKELSDRLGYGERQIIDKQIVPEPIAAEDNSQLEDKARTLVFDTGMTTITMDHRAMHYSHGVEDELMAVLYPIHPGILQSRSSLSSSKIQSHHSDEMTFSIFRFSEDNKPIPLSWKCGAYVEGLLVGTV